MPGKTYQLYILQLIIGFLLLNTHSIYANQNIIVILPQKTYYVQGFQLFKKYISQREHLNFKIYSEAPENNEDFIITLGSNKTFKVIEKTKHLFFFMVADLSLLNIVKTTNNKKISGIFFGPNPVDEIKSLKYFLSSEDVISIIYSKKTEKYINIIKKISKQEGLNIRYFQTDLQNFSENLMVALQEGKVLWMIPDPNIYNTITIKKTLVTAVQMGKLVWTFSPVLIKAGAFASFKIDKKEYIKEATEVFYQCYKEKKCQITFAKNFKIVLNKRLIKFWNIKLPKNCNKKIELE